MGTEVEVLDIHDGELDPRWKTRNHRVITSGKPIWLHPSAMGLPSGSPLHRAACPGCCPLWSGPVHCPDVAIEESVFIPTVSNGRIPGARYCRVH